MIIEALLGLIQDLLELLLSPINIPDLPQNVSTAISTGFGYILDGLGIFAAFTHYQYLCTLLGIVIVIEVAMLVYKFVMWLLKKIPMASVQ